MKKKIGYWVYAAFFTVFRLFPLNRDKVFFVATHDDSDEGNIGIVAEEIRRQMPEKKMVFLTKRDGIRHPFSCFVVTVCLPNNSECFRNIILCVIMHFSQFF